MLSLITGLGQVSRSFLGFAHEIAIDSHVLGRPPRESFLECAA